MDLPELDYMIARIIAEAEPPSLRDRFAMAALPMALERMGGDEIAAAFAYQIADAMLEARKPKTEGG